jgi:hypothetical protein
MGVKLPIQNNFKRSDGPTTWVRPADWPVITDTVGEVQFLMSDLGDSDLSLRTNFSRTSGSQNMVIDWGDGTTTTISAIGATTTNKTYTPGTGTPCSLGYTTFKIRVYFTGTGVSVISQCQPTALLISGNTFSSQECSVLEAYYGDGTIPTAPPTFESVAGNSSSLSYFNNLTYVKFPATCTWNSGINFNSCYNLVVLIMPISLGIYNNSLSSSFRDCRSLQEITFPASMTGISQLNSTFQNCFSLKKVTFPTSLNSVGDIQNCFGSCVNLLNVTIPSINNCSSMIQVFFNCPALEWVKFTSLPTSANVNFQSLFSTCPNLQNVYFPALVGNPASIFSCNSTFNSCTALKSIVFPSNMNLSSFANCFSGCTSIVSIILPISTPALITMSNAFNSCRTITSITLPTAGAPSVDFTNAFSSCTKLNTINIPAGYKFSSLIGAFQNCTVLKNLNWTPDVQNSFTNLTNTFGACTLLESVTLPSSMTGLLTLTNAFANCSSLKTITFPASLNAVTAANALFTNCNSLTSVTMPTSMSSNVNFSGAFQNCTKITSITLPDVVRATFFNFQAAFASCTSLKTVVLPGSAQLSLVTSIDSMFQNCSNLVTITNFDKIGSLTATPLINGSNNIRNRFTSISFAGPYSILLLNGSPITTGRTDVQSVRLLNTSAGQWTGSSPQINVAYTNMSTANLVQLFNDMAAQGVVVSKTINITGALGAAGLTAGDRLIITSKGWTITG